MTETTSDAAMTESSPPANPVKSLLTFGIMLLVTVGLGAVGGHFVGELTASQPSEANAMEPSVPQASPDQAGAPHTQFASIDLERITVNANEPRLQRFIHATIAVTVRKEAFDHVSGVLTERRDEIKDWLITYLSGCSLEEVRGPRNLNRIRREMQDSLNDMLWPNRDPLIESVLLREFQVQ